VRLHKKKRHGSRSVNGQDCHRPIRDPYSFWQAMPITPSVAKRGQTVDDLTHPVQHLMH